MADFDYINQLRKRAEATGNIVCLGLDPVLEKLPSSGCKEFLEKNKEPGRAISKFYIDLLGALVDSDAVPAMVKPNLAFYEQYGFDGLKALQAIIVKCHQLGIPVLLDGKRGDIGNTSKAYADALFRFWKADAATVAPYMGSDSVRPFIEYCDVGKGVYILVRTSNKGALDLQDLQVDGIPLYMKTAQKLVEWHRSGVCAVVGATYPKELSEISRFFVDSGKEIPLLIPGVGSQGGSVRDVVNALKSTGNDLALHRINSSSAINFAYIQQNTDDFCGASVKAMKELIHEIGFK